MNIDARRPKRIHESTEPVTDMFDALEDFSDRIGGSAWRERRVRKLLFTRSITLYLDEESEHLKRSLNPRKNQLILADQNDGETIEVKFRAARVRDNQTNDPYTTVYDISFSHTLPLRDIKDVAPDCRELVMDEMTPHTPLLLGGPETVTERFDLDETRTTTYTIDPAEAAVDYSYEITYDGEDFTVDGPSFSSEDTVDYEVHPTSVDTSEEYALKMDSLTEQEVERLVSTLAQTSLEDQAAFTAYLHALQQRTSEADAIDFGTMSRDEVEKVSAQLADHSLEDEIDYHAYMIAAQESGREEDAIELVGLSPRQHSIRIMSLLSILKSGLYVRPIDRRTDK
jgi:hypothetical protein